MRSFIDIERIRGARIGFTRPEKTGDVRESYPYEVMADRNEPLFVRVNDAIAINNVSSPDQSLTVAIDPTTARGFMELSDTIASHYAQNSHTFFFGRTFDEAKIRGAINMPVGPMDGVLVDAKLPDTMDSTLRVRITDSTVLYDRWDNQVEQLKAGDRVSMVVHFDKVIFCKKQIIPHFVAAGIKVRSPVVFPIERPTRTPTSVPLPEPSESEDEFFSE